MTGASYTFAERDRLTKLFLPENQRLLNDLSDVSADDICKIILGINDPGKCPRSTVKTYAATKHDSYIDTNFRYSRIFDFCRVIGVKNLYDIGCHNINQSFMLADWTTMTYTGMDKTFYLNDWRGAVTDDETLPDAKAKEIPPFCDGRIRFVQGYYPDVKPEILPDNIAIGCYTFTMCRGENIVKTAAALTADFERILFNVTCGTNDKETLTLWKNADWSGFEVHPIGPEGYLFATRFPEDIERLKKLYPCDEKGRFSTGIDSGFHHLDGTAPEDPYESYVNWDN